LIRIFLSGHSIVVLEHTLSTVRVHNAVCYSSCMVLSKGKKKFNSDA
jgi:hypothetical protein